jgi:hypothetical protein
LKGIEKKTHLFSNSTNVWNPGDDFKAMQVELEKSVSRYLAMGNGTFAVFLTFTGY